MNRIKLQRKELGVIAVDCGDVVCIPIDFFVRLVSGRGDDNDFSIVDKLVHEAGGVRCQFPGDGMYGVDTVTIHMEDGDEYQAVIIGGPEDSYVHDG